MQLRCVFARRHAEVVSHDIASSIAGKGTIRAYDGSGESYLMMGGSQAGFVNGTWYATPHPDIKFHLPSRARHAERVLFEKYWMNRLVLGDLRQLRPGLGSDLPCRHEVSSLGERHPC